MKEAALFLLYAVAPAAILAWAAVMVARVVRTEMAGRRADRRYAETTAAMDRGEITPLQAIMQHNETHTRFQREAPRQ